MRDLITVEGDSQSEVWKRYLQSLQEDLDAWNVLHILVLPTVVGILAITNLASEMMTQTLAYLCLFASCTGFCIGLNMKRHLNRISLRPGAFEHWVTVVGQSDGYRPSTIPLLLAGPLACAVWSIVLLITLFLTHIWHIHSPSLTVNSNAPSVNYTSTMQALPTIAADCNMRNKTTPRPAANGNDTTYLTGPSQIILLGSALISIAHFALNAIFFTRLGVLQRDTLDTVELSITQPVSPEVVGYEDGGISSAASELSFPPNAASEHVLVVSGAATDHLDNFYRRHGLTLTKISAETFTLKQVMTRLQSPTRLDYFR
ncbi:hypothetical protein PHLGIDRAFT_121216 [Phlebiopsis gigantea 11061_1 CR5-6]|uniref:Transmembrane protein n=1 Tax=Phlebiopsis gigantea (strain 11061_1 CR5-6) TaxID=745531 RepID=A0A0C3S2J7_PHLG1|nr:hypothetical protein PHLGIDRAFT_121216 [Phlebiopsis gigantea 11061_1 CR5-6]